MKSIWALAAFVIIGFGGYDIDTDPEKRTKTDAMLFGDVKSNNEHIPFASIIIKGTTIGAAADATGHFKMANLPVGEQTVVISAMGFKPKEKKVVMEAKKSVTILVELEPDNIGLEQVVVSANRNEKNRHESPTIVNSLNASILERTHNVTLSDGLNFSPGLRMENNCQNCGFTQVRMNGLEGPYSQILINSRPVFSGLAGVYGLELIPANMIERVEIIRGGGSAMYGSNAIAGTINLITKDPIANNFAISSNYAVNGVGLGNNISTAEEYNLNFNGSFVSDDYKSGMSLFAFHRKRDPFDANGDGFSEQALIKNSTFGARVFQRLANRGKLTADYFNINEFRRGGNKFDLPLHEADITESVTHAINTGAVTFDQLLREADKFSAFFSFQHVNRDSYYGANRDLSAYGQTEDFTYSSGLQYVRQFEKLVFAPASITSGLELNSSSLKDKKLGYYDIETSTHIGNTQVADQSIFTKAAFVQAEWSAEPLVVTAGFRFDNYLVSDKSSGNDDISGNVLSPRISLLVNFTHDLQLRAGFAKGFRAPQIFDEDLHIETSGARKVLHKNADGLKQESSNSYTLSMEYNKHLGTFQYQILVEGFYTRLIDPFSNVYGAPDEDGTVIYTRVNSESGARVKGVNLEFNASPLAYLQIQSGFTIQKSEYEDPQEFGETRFFRSPGEYGYISLDYQISKKLDFAFTGNYTGSMLIPYFGPKLEEPEQGQLNRSDSFFDAGVKLSYTFSLSDYLNLEVNSGIKNIFNSYQNDFDTGENRDPAYIYGPGSPRVIYFGIRIGNFL